MTTLGSWTSQRTIPAPYGARRIVLTTTYRGARRWWLDAEEIPDFEPVRDEAWHRRARRMQTRAQLARKAADVAIGVRAVAREVGRFAAPLSELTPALRQLGEAFAEKVEAA
jgi:hypothetical protein